MPDQNPEQPQQPQKGILNQTLGELLQNNTHAQGMIMKAMQITPQQFQQMLQATGNNQLMNQTIGDLFKNGTVQQATSVQQLTPEQFQQLAGTIQQHPSMQTFQIDNQPQKPSVWNSIKKFF